MGVHAWSGVAYNGATESENRIHGDDVARRYGFRGGLVPGVTVYAYLVEPAIQEWGIDWLEHGAASVVLRKPLYDHARFVTEVTPQSARAYDGRVVDEHGTVCADGRVWMPDAVPPPPVRRDDPPVVELEARPPATREAMEELRARGMGALRLTWRGDGEMGKTAHDLDEMSDLVRPDRAGFANPGFVLGLANWALARNVRLDAWIHAQSDAQNLGAVPLGAQLVVESTITDLFSRGGHEFVDLDVAAFIDDRAVLFAKHRAIYRLREVA